MWTWQGSSQASDSGPGSSSSGAHSMAPVPGQVHPGANQGQPQGQELSEMLQMLDQGGATSFEELNINMFNTPFE